MTISTMAQALQARDAGMASSAEHAEQDAPGWGERAYQALISSPFFDDGEEWTVDYARSWLYACGLDQPSSERAWGALTQRLLRDKRIEQVGFQRSASSNNSWKPSYRLVKP